MTPREIALASFWTERPLVQLFVAATGADTFSLRQLIAFAETLPSSILRSLETQRGDASQAPPHAVAPKETIQKARRQGRI